MSKPATPATADSATPAAKGGKTKLLIIVAAVVLLGGGGAAAFLTMRKPAEGKADSKSEEAEKSEGRAKSKKKKAHAQGGGIVTFEPFVVNLADQGGGRFLRASVRLVVEEKDAEHIQKSEVTVTRIRSAVLELLAQQTADQIVTAEGKTALKKAIGDIASEIVEPAEVLDVLFSDFVVQF